MGLRGIREKVVAMPALWAGVGLSVGGNGCAGRRVSVRDDRSNRNKSERQAAKASALWLQLWVSTLNWRWCLQVGCGELLELSEKGIGLCYQVVSLFACQWVFKKQSDQHPVR